MVAKMIGNVELRRSSRHRSCLGLRLRLKTCRRNDVSTQISYVFPGPMQPLSHTQTHRWWYVYTNPSCSARANAASLSLSLTHTHTQTRRWWYAYANLSCFARPNSAYCVAYLNRNLLAPHTHSYTHTYTQTQTHTHTHRHTSTSTHTYTQMICLRESLLFCQAQCSIFARYTRGREITTTHV